MLIIIIILLTLRIDFLMPTPYIQFSNMVLLTISTEVGWILMKHKSFHDLFLIFYHFF